ncbi:putative GANP/Nin1/mts3/eIF-3 p25 family protein [Colletotrichum sublineola]|uniref:Putative GANP/Nin1/mts3/eIF-3 p25 family protein n=1 Tax=Colletotrichum sublineola TaxID=1173701 RepID=A0A066X842_COLSU|nr:putative GANP/Nin1/mts3/eIF-3 p25 family protein [Colletotrichum sublineola]
MAERNLQQVLTQLRGKGSSLPYTEASALLSKAKLYLLQLNALTPSSGAAQQQQTSPQLLALARETYEHGALASIRAKNPDAFTRYVQQLQPFYELPSNLLPPNLPDRNKVTGLYLLLLLTQGRYAEFHSELESLANREGGGDSSAVEGDKFLGYPIRLERWLMEGSYDRILTFQIRSEIASSSERAYPSLPISSAKSLLFLDSEGDVISFAQQRGWILKDGQIFFPDTAEGVAAEDGTTDKEMSQMVIENTLGYARELETIV